MTALYDDTALGLPCLGRDKISRIEYILERIACYENLPWIMLDTMRERLCGPHVPGSKLRGCK